MKIKEYIDNLSFPSAFILRFFLPYYVLTLFRFVFEITSANPEILLFEYEPIFQRLCFYLVLAIATSLLSDILIKKSEH